MNKKTSLIRLEDLPDEIFLHEIFPLFSWEELYHHFFGLNQRFNNILQSSNHLKFIVDGSNKDHPALTFFTPCIRYLTVCLGQFDITPFSALRSLILQYPSLQQRNSIRPKNFPYLEYLNLSYPLEDSILLNLIFSNAFQYLKKCKLDRTAPNHSWLGSPELRSLKISVHGQYETICVLRACPNISRLNIIIYNASESNESFPQHSISCMMLPLRRLLIHSKFEIFASISTLMPNLEWLTFDGILTCYKRERLEFNFERLAKILSNLGQLRYLYFVVSFSDFNRQTNLHTLHPLFRHVQDFNRSRTVIVSSSID